MSFLLGRQRRASLTLAISINLPWHAHEINPSWCKFVSPINRHALGVLKVEKFMLPRRKRYSRSWFVILYNLKILKVLITVIIASSYWFRKWYWVVNQIIYHSGVDIISHRKMLKIVLPIHSILQFCDVSNKDIYITKQQICIEINWTIVKIHQRDSIARK